MHWVTAPHIWDSFRRAPGKREEVPSCRMGNMEGDSRTSGEGSCLGWLPGQVCRVCFLSTSHTTMDRQASPSSPGLGVPTIRI